MDHSHSGNLSSSPLWLAVASGVCDVQYCQFFNSSLFYVYILFRWHYAIWIGRILKKPTEWQYVHVHRLLVVVFIHFSVKSSWKTDVQFIIPKFRGKKPKREPFFPRGLISAVWCLGLMSQNVDNFWGSEMDALQLPSTQRYTHQHEQLSVNPSPLQHFHTHLAVDTCFSWWVWWCMESGWTPAAVFILVPSVGGPSTVFVLGSPITVVSGLHPTMIHVYFTFLLRMSLGLLSYCSTAAEKKNHTFFERCCLKV